MKKIYVVLLLTLFLSLAAQSALSAPADDVHAKEAVAIVRIPSEIQASADRSALFRHLCEQVAAEAGAHVTNVNEISEHSISGVMVAVSERSAEELSAALRRSPHVIAASPNRRYHLVR